jgi:cyclopropane fatty-acyl-phospholipid synthase-like methyltransferase
MFADHCVLLQTEKDRLDLHNEIFLMLMQNKLYTAPLDHPQRVLDVGTGTGIWAIDMADRHPEAEVRGVDLSPIQPRWVPRNWYVHSNPTRSSYSS